MSKLSVKFDPTGKYAKGFDDEGKMKQWLFEACGLIPTFYFEVMHDIVPQKTTAEGIMQLLMEVYGFGTDVRMQGKIEDDGNYVYPEDPDLAPYMKIKGFGHDVYIYPYGIVGIVDRVNNDQSVARMD